MERLIIHGEECLPIPEFSLYHISITGRIYRTVPITKKETILKNTEPEILYYHEVSSTLQFDKGIYPTLRAGLKTDQGHLTTSRVGMLVAKAFGVYPKKPLHYTLHYKDGNARNCFLANLEFKKRQPANAILTKKDVKQIRKLIDEKIPLRHIADKFGVCEMQIGRIKTGENWGSGKKKILPPQAPFHVEDGKKRRLLASFKHQRVASTEIVRPFTIKRDKKNPENNIMIGIFKGYKFTKGHQNVSRARVIVHELNKYFFSEQMAEKQSMKIKEKLSPKNRKDVHQLKYAK